MRYIDWIALAYRMRNIIRNIYIELDVIFQLDIKARTEKMNTYNVELNGIFELILNVDAKKTIIKLLGSQDYYNLMVELEIYKSLITTLSSSDGNELIINLESLITRMKLLKVNSKLDFKIIAKALDTLTRLMNSTSSDELIINVEAFAGVLHEIMRDVEFTLDCLIEIVISRVIELSLLKNNFINDVTIDFDKVLALILDTFNLEAQFISNISLIEVKSEISMANAKFKLDIIAEAKKEIMRKMLEAYPLLLSDVLKMSILDFYYIYE